MKQVTFISSLLLSFYLNAQESNDFLFSNNHFDSFADVEEFDKDYETIENKAIESKRLISLAKFEISKMNYSYAAELYESLIKKNPTEANQHLMVKLGDAFYLNGNMANANIWYAKAYEADKKTTTAATLYNYAQSLKALKKFKLSNHMFILHNKKEEKKNSVNMIENSVLKKNFKIENEFKVAIKNASFNSKKSEVAPMFYGSNELVFSSSQKVNDDKTNSLNLFFTDIDSDKITAFSEAINTNYHETSATFSADNKTMYFTSNIKKRKRTYFKRFNNPSGIFISRKLNNIWQKAVPLPFNNMSYSVAHPALSPDGKKLYFVSDMPGTIGETDIFVVDVKDNGTFSTPKNLGPNINTTKKESHPFLVANQIYFSSNGHEGYGNLDVFTSQHIDSTWFSTAKNLGKEINSAKDDFSFIINDTTSSGYFSSNRSGGKGKDDIYSFTFLK